MAGDAAHQTPPFFGQGLCHGLRDAVNLAWKLDLVMRGLAADTLLDSYQTERDAQVRHVIGRAIEVGRTICELDPDAAAARDKRIRAEKGMRTAAELIAPIASNIVANGAGERFINPSMGEERFLDDLAGHAWRLFCAVGAKAPKLQVLSALNVTTIDTAVLPDPEGHMARWFLERDVAYALVRPDHYLAATSTTQTGLRDAINATALPEFLNQPENV